METFSALLAICAGNSPVPGEFLAQRPVTRSFDVFFDLRPNKRLSIQSWCWWSETPSSSLWRHRNDIPRKTSWQKTLKLHITGLCEGNSSVIGEFPVQRASNAENVSIWWRHHGSLKSNFNKPALENKPLLTHFVQHFINTGTSIKSFNLDNGMKCWHSVSQRAVDKGHLPEFEIYTVWNEGHSEIPLDVYRVNLVRRSLYWDGALGAISIRKTVLCGPTSKKHLSPHYWPLFSGIHR